MAHLSSLTMLSVAYLGQDIKNPGALLVTLRGFFYYNCFT
ncbi:hypothetical protein ARTHRO9V_50011 [Arthrobacter sp. 9V]|nr:hypothetical protein ARTHRO9V_50011 [Arthrobacter sp. 9V]